MEESISKKCLWRADISNDYMSSIVSSEIEMTHFMTCMKKESTGSNQSSDAT